MSELRDMMGRIAKPGYLEWIGLRSGHRDRVQSVDAVLVTAGGLSGDHARPGKRAVTLIQFEHLAVIASVLGRPSVDPALLRRNLVISGINLSALKDQEVQIGALRLRITGPCMPCSRMEAALGFGGYAALRGHGGWCAEALQPGRIALGDPVDAAVPDQPLV